MNPHRKPRHRWEVAPVRPDLADLETRQWPLPGAPENRQMLVYATALHEEARLLKPTPPPVAPARSR